MPRLTFLPLLALVALCLASPTHGQDDPHAAIRKYLDQRTVVVGWLDLRKIDVPQVAEFFAQNQLASTSDEQRERATALQQALLQLDATHVYWIAEASDLVRGPSTVVIPTQKAKAAALLLGSMNAGDTQMATDDGDVVLSGDKRSVESLLKRDGDPPANLLMAMETCQGPHGIAAALPTQLLGQVIQIAQQLWEDQPAELAKAAEAAVSVRGLSLSGEIPFANAKLEVVSKSPAGAQLVVDLINRLQKDRLGDNADLLKMHRRESSAEILIDNAQTAAKQCQALQKLTGAGVPSTVNDMKQIGLALHNYHDIHQHLPPQSLVNNKGQRLLSWRVLILPYIEQAALYEQFHLDEPWDSEHNLKLAQQIPPVFAMKNATKADRAKTCIVAPLTPSSAFGKRGAPVAFRDVLDGTSNTIWVVHADPSKAVVWSKPEDLPVPDKAVFPLLKSGKDDQIIAGFADGSVRILPRGIKEDTLRSMLSINGQEIIDDEALK